MGRYAFLEDVALADCAFEVEGADLDDLFATAARALAEVMVDPASLGAAVEREVVLEAGELDLLLYDWLSELIFLKDRDGAVFPVAEVSVGGTGPFRLRARLCGGVIEPGRTALGADPKAVTLHQFRLEREEGGWRARVIVDI
jgi:SHS2 domain-containing protein